MDTGWLSGATAANINSGGAAWIDVDNAKTSNNTYTYNGNLSGTSDRLAIYNFTTGIPASAIITGFEVGIEGYKNVAGEDYDVALYTNVTTVSPAAGDVSDIKSVAVPDSESTVTLGNDGDLWGETWTTAEVTASTFGIGITKGSAFTNVYIDHVKLKIYYVLGGSRVQFIG